MTQPSTGAWSNRAAWVGLVVVCAALIGHGVYYLFVQDDAYIFFRYSENWINGWGPVWNEGERVEGYTSPAWLATVTVARLATGSFEPAVHVISLSLGIGALLLLFSLTGAVVRDAWAGLAAALLMASDRTFALWSTSGMETRLFGFLILATALLIWRRWHGEISNVEKFALGPILLLLCLTRPEGFLFAGLMLVALLVARPSAIFSRWEAIGLIAWAAGVGAHLWWRWTYYGDFLPNTFYAKVPGFDFHSGARFVADFATSFPLFSIAGAVAVVFHIGAAVIARKVTFTSTLSILIATYVGYVTAIGGGFMEFRMLDAVLGPASVLIVSAIWALLRKIVAERTSALALAVVIVASTIGFSHGMMFEDQKHAVMTRSEMWEDSTKAWVLVGQFFGRIGLADESLATTAAGAIPFYSKMRSLDQLGLNDRFVAHSAPAGGNTVGHRKQASDAYIARQGITYVIGHPRLYLQPRVQHLRQDEFFMRIEDPSGITFYLAVRSTLDRDAVINSLRRRGVLVVDSPQS